MVAATGKRSELPLILNVGVKGSDSFPIRRGVPLKGKTGDRWRTLCENAAVEQDSDKLLELKKEINRLLDEKEQRLQSARRATESIN